MYCITGNWLASSAKSPQRLILLLLLLLLVVKKLAKFNKALHTKLAKPYNADNAWNVNFLKFAEGVPLWGWALVV